MSVPDPLRTALADRYAIERELGRSGMATVYRLGDRLRRRAHRENVPHGVRLLFVSYEPR